MQQHQAETLHVRLAITDAAMNVVLVKGLRRDMHMCTRPSRRLAAT